MRVSKEKIKEIIRLVDAGEHLNDIEKMVGVSKELIDLNLAKWIQSEEGEESRFKTVVGDSFLLSEKMRETLPEAMRKLENRDVDGFFLDVAPIAAAQMAHDSVNSSDERIRHSAQKDILDRAGFKPKTQIELYSRFEKMDVSELVGSIRGMLAGRPDLLDKIRSRLLSSAIQTADEGMNESKMSGDVIMITGSGEGSSDE